MKKVIVVMLMLVGFATFAQEEKQAGKRAEMEKMTPEQKSQLRLKKLTIELGLNDSQQKEIGKIITEQNAKRNQMTAERKANKEKGIKPTADERFARENKRLDDEKIMKDRMQKILTADQMKKWEDMKSKGRERMKDRMKKKSESQDKKE